MAYRVQQFTVGTTPVLILPSNKKRTAYHITHVNAGQTAFYGPDPTVTLTTGHELIQGAEENIESFSGHDVHMAVWAIASNASARITVREDYLTDKEYEEQRK